MKKTKTKLPLRGGADWTHAHVPDAHKKINPPPAELLTTRRRLTTHTHVCHHYRTLFFCFEHINIWSSCFNDRKRPNKNKNKTSGSVTDMTHGHHAIDIYSSTWYHNNMELLLLLSIRPYQTCRGDTFAEAGGYVHLNKKETVSVVNFCRGKQLKTHTQHKKKFSE